MRHKCLLIVSLLVASLQAATVDDLYLALNFDSTEYKVSYCLENASGSLDIPGTYNGLPVTSIGVRAFDDCTNLNSITIPHSVTSIGDAAFEDCTNLNSITIPDGLISIEFSTFKNCSSLTSISIPDSVTSIGSNAFSGCSSLNSGFVPDAEIANNIGYETGSFLSNSMFELIADRLLQDDDFVARLIELIPQGPAGETGPQGIQGDTGPQGPPGLDSSAIQTLRASEPHVEASQDGTFNVQYRIQSSKDLNNWNEETVINSKMDPHNSSKQFLRLTVE